MQVGKAAAVRSEINVTPLVDVVLVLLIIFMVITPMLQKGPAVKLPMTVNPPKKPEDSKQILVAVRQDKMIYVEKDGPMPAEQFAIKIKEAFERNPGSSIVIKGDARLPYGDVKNAMLKVKEAGFEQVGLIVERRDVGVP
ncbi:MAG TPA: biopolymer transporter ExbD [Candidatus Polarisedimenticolaceae bacterium]|nr:biopolymer transporter ExbD [Candidatus Polarisedimenticolaceae bacterium]